jgi:uroporphyrinogen-III synthase
MSGKTSTAKKKPKVTKKAKKTATPARRSASLPRRPRSADAGNAKAMKAGAPKKKAPLKKPAALVKARVGPQKKQINGEKPVAKPAKAAVPIANRINGAHAAIVPALKAPRKPGKKGGITLPPPPVIEVSNFPKHKVKSLLVSQPQPADPERNPYYELAKKHNISVTFRQFIRIEGLTGQEFRAQRVDILEHGAVILTSKLAVDHYFRLCQEMRITVPETMKYFCINEQTAYYLQKYIQYRKRKIFFGHGTIIDLVDVIRKNRSEKFLLPVSDVHREQIADFLEEVKITFTKAIFYKTVAADLTDLKSLDGFDMIVFFTPVGIKSLKQNFPNFKQGNTRIAAFGYSSAQMVKSLGYRLDVFAPNPQNPSMTGALDLYIREANRR